MEAEDQLKAMRGMVRAMMEASGLDATGLAKAAGIAPSTLTRFLNAPVKHLLTARTLAKLSKASGVPVPAGGSVTAPPEQELLAAFRSTDDQGREMILRFARSLSQGAETEAGEGPPRNRARGDPHRRARPVKAATEEGQDNNGLPSQ